MYVHVHLHTSVQVLLEEAKHHSGKKGQETSKMQFGKGIYRIYKKRKRQDGITRHIN